MRHVKNLQIPQGRNPMTGDPTKFAHPRRFSSRKKAEIIAKADILTMERTEDAARRKHLLLCRNAISDEELAFWRETLAKYGLPGLRRDTRRRIERRAETINSWGAA